MTCICVSMDLRERLLIKREFESIRFQLNYVFRNRKTLKTPLHSISLPHTNFWYDNEKRILFDSIIKSVALKHEPKL